MSRLIQGADQLSNDQLLGITDDYTTRAHVSGVERDSEIDPENPDEPVVVFKARRKLHTLNEELLLSKRGLPTLLENLDHFKFIRDQSKLDKKRRHRQLSYSKNSDNYRQKYSQSYHFANLTNLLYVYQKFGHDIFPKSKLKDFLPLLSRAVNGKVLIKRYLHEVVLADIRKKRNGGVDPAADIMANNNPETVQSTTTTSITTGTTAYADDSDDDIYTESVSNIPKPRKSAVIEEEDDDDGEGDEDNLLLKDIDALLKRGEQRLAASLTSTTTNNMDHLDIPILSQTQTQTQAPAEATSTQQPLFFNQDDEDEDLGDFPDDDDEDEFDIVMQQQQQQQQQQNNDEDDDDEEMNLMREMDM